MDSRSPPTYPVLAVCVPSIAGVGTEIRHSRLRSCRFSVHADDSRRDRSDHRDAQTLRPACCYLPLFAKKADDDLDSLRRHSMRHLCIETVSFLPVDMQHPGADAVLRPALRVTT